MFRVDQGEGAGLLSLVKRRLRGNFTAAYNYLEGSHKNEKGKLFSVVPNDTAKVNGHILWFERFMLGIRKIIVTKKCNTGPGCPEQSWTLYQRGL